jgi:hypothetical protein
MKEEEGKSRDNFYVVSDTIYKQDKQRRKKGGQNKGRREEQG